MSAGDPLAPRRVDGSMSLLVDMTGAALDPSYAEAAVRRAAGPSTRRRLPRLLLAGLVAIGLATGVVAAQVRKQADELGEARRGLLADIGQRTAQTDRLAAEAARLRTTVGATRDRSLSQDAQGRAAAAQLAALELVTGTVAVHGPGVEVTLRDARGSAAPTAPRGGQAADGRIFDSDLQAVVNALWAAGAEAISVNGQRVTVQTAIRSAGEAILVDLRPLSPPYVLRAIGERDTLEPTFVDSATARRFQTWTSLYGLGFEVRRASDLRLPAAVPPLLRLAIPGGDS